MDEKSDPHVEQPRAEDDAEKPAERLRNSCDGVIHKAREVGRDHCCPVMRSSMMDYAPEE